MFVHFSSFFYVSCKCRISLEDGTHTCGSLVVREILACLAVEEWQLFMSTVSKSNSNLQTFRNKIIKWIPNQLTLCGEVKI